MAWFRKVIEKNMYWPGYGLSRQYWNLSWAELLVQPEIDQLCQLCQACSCSSLTVKKTMHSTAVNNGLYTMTCFLIFTQTQNNYRDRWVLCIGILAWNTHTQSNGKQVWHREEWYDNTFTFQTPGWVQANPAKTWMRGSKPFQKGGLDKQIPRVTRNSNCKLQSIYPQGS